MRKFISLLVLLAFGALSGCASVRMQDTTLVKAPNEKKALVSFVRPRVFMGDGLDVDIWDGEHYLGSLSAGSVIQCEVDPGKHVFLASSENWGYAAGDLQAGKKYFIKANIFPGVVYGRVALGVAKADDKRVDEWLSSLKPTMASDKDKKEVEDKKRVAIRAAVSDFNAGKVTYAQMQPEDGR